MAVGKAGRPPYVPSEQDRVKVAVHAAINTPHDKIAALIGVDAKTLRKHFRFELDEAKQAIGYGAAFNLARLSRANDFRAIPAAIYITKAMLGWSEKQTIEHAGPNGGPMQHQHAIDFSGYTDAELDALEPVLAKAATKAAEESPIGKKSRKR